MSPRIFGAPASFDSGDDPQRERLERRREALARGLHDQDAQADVLRAEASRLLEDVDRMRTDVHGLERVILDAQHRVSSAEASLGKAMRKRAALADRVSRGDAGKVTTARLQRLLAKHGPALVQLDADRQTLASAQRHLAVVKQQSIEVNRRAEQLVHQADQPGEADQDAAVRAQLAQLVEEIDALSAQRGAGSSAEERVAAVLEHCAAVAVVHGVQARGLGDIDHVVIGPGLLALETKYARGSASVGINDDGHSDLFVDGELLRGARGDTSVIDQVVRAAQWLEAETRVTATPVIVLSDAALAPVDIDGVWACNLQDLAALIERINAGSLDKDAALRIAAGLV